MSVHNQKHDNALYSEAMRNELQRKGRPSDEEYPYTTLSVAETMPEYTKIDPSFIYMEIETEDRYPEATALPYKDGITGMALRKLKWYRLRMWANHPDGLKTIAHGMWYRTEKKALDIAGSEFPILAIKNADGLFEYPYFDERIAKIKQEARDRRARRDARAAEKLGTLMDIARLVGP